MEHSSSRSLPLNDSAGGFPRRGKVVEKKATSEKGQFNRVESINRPTDRLDTTYTKPQNTSSLSVYRSVTSLISERAPARGVEYCHCVTLCARLRYLQYSSAIARDVSLDSTVIRYKLDSTFDYISPSVDSSLHALRARQAR